MESTFIKNFLSSVSLYSVVLFCWQTKECCILDIALKESWIVGHFVDSQGCNSIYGLIWFSTWIFLMKFEVKRKVSLPELIQS